MTGAALLHGMVREGPSVEVIFDGSPERWKGVSHMGIWKGVKI